MMDHLLVVRTSDSGFNKCKWFWVYLQWLEGVTKHMIVSSFIEYHKGLIQIIDYQLRLNWTQCLLYFHYIVGLMYSSLYALHIIPDLYKSHIILTVVRKWYLWFEKVELFIQWENCVTTRCLFYVCYIYTHIGHCYYTVQIPAYK